MWRSDKAKGEGCRLLRVVTCGSVWGEGYFQQGCFVQVRLGDVFAFGDKGCPSLQVGVGRTSDKGNLCPSFRQVGGGRRVSPASVIS